MALYIGCCLLSDQCGRHVISEVRDVLMQPCEEAAFLAFSQHEPGVSKEALSRKQARELSIAVRCVSLVGEAPLPLTCVRILYDTGPAAIIEAARASAASMSSFELVARTAVEMAGVWPVTWLVKSIAQ